MQDGWMSGMGPIWILVLGVLGLGIWFAASALARGRTPFIQSPDEGGPEKKLKDRLASGEIDEKEYRARMEALQHRS